MLSRRAFLLSTVVSTLPLSRARAQAAPPADSARDSGATVLQLERRTIEVDGKSASVFGIRHPTAPSA
jgi:hypothetical protein